MRSTFAVLLAPAVLTVATSLAAPQTQDLIPLYSVTHYTYNDNFYSTNPSQIQEAINTYGYSNKQKVAFVHGGSFAIGADAVTPFHRTYGYAPYTTHFYTTDFNEVNTVTAAPYSFTYEGEEGYLRTDGMKPGSAPMYRLSYWWPATGDLMHWYGTDLQTRNQMIGQSWTDEGIEGYVFPVPTPNTPLPNGGGYSVQLHNDTSNGTIYLSATAVRNPGDPVQWSSCGGTADLYRDGAFFGTVGFSLVQVPGSFNLWECRSTPSGFKLSGMHTYRAEFTGYRAYLQPAYPGTPGYVVVTPYTDQQTF
jgi:hypothetical protein